MFAALVIIPAEKGIVPRVFERLFPTRPEITQVAVKNGAPFFLIKIKDRKGEVQWDEIAQLAGRCTKRMLLPERIEPPIESGIGRYQSNLLSEKIMFNTAFEVLKKGNLEPSEIKLSIVDMNGRFVEEVKRFVPFSGFLRVITNNLTLYNQLAQAIMDDYGATIVVNTELSSAMDSTIIISQDENIRISAKDAVIFTHKNSFSNGRCIITGGKINLSENYLRLLPDNISELDFASALYELCGVKNFSQLVHTTVIAQGDEISTYKLIKLIENKL